MERRDISCRSAISKGMAAKAVELLSDPARHSLFRTQARRRAEQHFDAARIIPQYEAFYEELLKA